MGLSQVLILARQMEYLVVTLQAPQKTDIWLKITKLISDVDCHIRQAQGLKLAGETGILILITGNWNTIVKLETGLKRLSNEEGILLITKRSKPLENKVQLLPYFVEVLALDQLGMLAHICTFFSKQEISIENLQLESYVSTATNAPMFSLKASLGIPSITSIGDLRERFILFCEELNIDGVIEPDKR